MMFDAQDSSDMRIATEWASAVQGILEHWVPAGFQCRSTAASADFGIPEAERARVANAVPCRQAEFIAGRWCAFSALEQLGVAAQSLPAGPLGAPVWPDGVVGSITHDAGVCTAVVARSTLARGIGVDLFEQARKVDMLELAPLILSDDELRCSQAVVDRAAFTQLSFCAKESVVKAVSASAGRYLDLREIRVSLGERIFAANVEGVAGQVRGRWARTGPFILSFALLEH